MASCGRVWAGRRRPGVAPNDQTAPLGMDDDAAASQSDAGNSVVCRAQLAVVDNRTRPDIPDLHAESVGRVGGEVAVDHRNAEAVACGTVDRSYAVELGRAARNDQPIHRSTREPEPASLELNFRIAGRDAGTLRVSGHESDRDLAYGIAACDGKLTGARGARDPSAARNKARRGVIDDHVIRSLSSRISAVLVRN